MAYHRKRPLQQLKVADHKPKGGAGAKGELSIRTDTCSPERATNEVSEPCDFQRGSLLHPGQHFADPDFRLMAIVVVHSAVRVSMDANYVTYPNGKCRPSRAIITDKADTRTTHRVQFAVGIDPCFQGIERSKKRSFVACLSAFFQSRASESAPLP